jgi:hypothetical protein
MTFLLPFNPFTISGTIDIKSAAGAPATAYHRELLSKHILLVISLYTDFSVILNIASALTE